MSNLRAIIQFFEAWCALTIAHLLIRFARLQHVLRVLDRVPAMSGVSASEREREIANVRRAVGRARRLFFGDAKCLSASTACAALLRLRGMPARLVIGVRTPPFEAHAWVEVEGVVVNDDAAVTRTYSVLKAV